MLSDLQDDGGDGIVNHTEQGEDDQVGNDHEEVVPGGLSSIQTGAGRGALVLADPPHDDREEEAENERQCRGQDTGHDGELG